MFFELTLEEKEVRKKASETFQHTSYCNEAEKYLRKYQKVTKFDVEDFRHFLLRCYQEGFEYGSKATFEKNGFRLVERQVKSPAWEFVHNCLAYPLLTIYRPWGIRLRAYAAEKMYGDDSGDYA